MTELLSGNRSPLRRPLVSGEIKIGNRIAVQPMEGWDGLADGNPSEHTIRRWQRFGNSGAKLIWGGEAVAVSHEGRANPNQLLAAPHTEQGLAKLRTTLIEQHRLTTGSDEGLADRPSTDRFRTIQPPERPWPPRAAHSLPSSNFGSRDWD